MNRIARGVLGLLVLGWVTVGCSDSSGPVGISSFGSDAITLAAAHETIDFEGVAEGTENPSVFGDGGSGPIATSAGPATASCPDADTAIIYDTSAGPGADPDLDVQSQQGNVLIVEEDLADTDGDGDPDDCFNGGNLTIDFSGVDAAGVTAESVVVLDIEQPTGESTVDLLGPGDALITTIDLPFTGDGGIATVDLGSTPGVVKLVFHFVTSGATDDIVFIPPDRGREGCTPGKWKNWTGLKSQPNLWPEPPFQDDEVDDWFTGALSSLGNDTLLERLDGGGGPGLLGKQKILLRAAIAALLNATSSGVAYPLTQAEVIAMVNAALAAGTEGALTDLATELDDYNNLGCPF